MVTELSGGCPRLLNVAPERGRADGRRRYFYIYVQSWRRRAARYGFKYPPGCLPDERRGGWGQMKAIAENVQRGSMWSLTVAMAVAVLAADWFALQTPILLTAR